MSSAPDLKPIDALSQVIFIHDYLQLVFQDERFSIFNVSEVARDGKVLRWGESGFCDALVGLIDQRVVTATTAQPSKLALTFEDGTEFHVLSGAGAARGPEAFKYCGADNLCVVEQNA